ncbi:uncharacterized protein LOC123322670 [Coccinella septempunctata]|uniref:uncharacterized protein LOC123322670 n=1 Tax=Coccinella septempunctata TaxID=41139 RepID=UPI001D074B45|nr:uncharacterized protein LOC123322670 [Coccinella septempunctata]
MLSSVLVTCVVALIYILVIKPLSYWKDRNVKTSKLIPLFGENLWVLLGFESFLEQFFRIYDIFPNDRYYGLYQFTKPILFLRTPELIKQLCVKDFDHFQNRRAFVPETAGDLFSKNLIAMKGQKWKDMRSTLSPTFTSSKMKAMFNLVYDNATSFTDYFLKHNEKIIEVEFKDAMSRFTNDAIANTAYGLQIDSLRIRDNAFYLMGRKGTNFAGYRMKFTILMYQLAPKLASFFRLPLIDSEAQSFFINIVKDNIEMRQLKNIKGPDVLSLLLESKKYEACVKEPEDDKEGFAVVEEDLETRECKHDLSITDIAAQAFLFFIAGFEGVSNLLCYTAYELATHPDIQGRLIDEVDKNCSNGKMPSYMEIMNMEYLDMVISEALRKWPFAPTTDRVVTKEYTIQPEKPGEQPLTLEPGTVMMISIVGLHRDPKYFENPDKFDPERFSAENKKKITPCTYIPFGIGPRNCIGQRFALMEVKTLIFKILCHFEIVPIEKTQIPLKMDKNAYGYIPIDGFHLGLKKRYILSATDLLILFIGKTRFHFDTDFGQRNYVVTVFQMLAIFLVACAVVLFYILAIRPLNYWKNRNVKTSKIIPLFGENLWVILGFESFLEQLHRIYNMYPNERYYGFYQFTKPILFLRTPELIKQLCVKDFDHFLNRQTFVPETSDDLLSKNLISLKGQKWKDMRSTLSPTFTSSKMKAMFNLISKNAERFTDYFMQQNEKIVEVEFKDAMSRFTNDAIANTAYGLEVDSLKDRDNTFYAMGRKGTNFVGYRTKFAIFMYQFAPKLAAFFGLPLIDSEAQSFFVDIVKENIEMRKAENIKRPDVVGMLLESNKNEAVVKDSEDDKGGFAVVEEHLEAKEIKHDLSLMDIAAQTFLFFIAGFEGVSNLLCYTAYELATNPDIQERLIDEVDKYHSNGKMPSYGEIMNMEYLDMVITETLRKWPFALATDRVVTKEYTIQPEKPGEQPLTLEPGTVLLISIVGLHRDPKYFENPDKFDPDRFSAENKKKIIPYTYIPFGIGPRNCIGNRFALMEVKTLIFKILCHFEIVPIEKTQIPLKMNKNAFGFIPTDGFHLGLKRRI